MTTAHGENDWKIRVNAGEEHPVAHVHVIFRDGSRVSIAIDTLAILAGGVRPQKRIVPAISWILAHRDELATEYWRLNP
jgi:hypothetical protein